MESLECFIQGFHYHFRYTLKVKYHIKLILQGFYLSFIQTVHITASVGISLAFTITFVVVHFARLSYVAYRQFQQDQTSLFLFSLRLTRFIRQVPVDSSKPDLFAKAFNLWTVIKSKFK